MKAQEISHLSQKYLNLENCALANLNASGNPDQLRVFGIKGDILEPGGFLANTTNTTNTMGACQRQPKTHFRSTRCWLLSAKANRRKNSSPRHNQFRARMGQLGLVSLGAEESVDGTSVAA